MHALPNSTHSPNNLDIFLLLKKVYLTKQSLREVILDIFFFFSFLFGKGRKIPRSLILTSPSTNPSPVPGFRATSIITFTSFESGTLKEKEKLKQNKREQVRKQEFLSHSKKKELKRIDKSKELTDKTVYLWIEALSELESSTLQPTCSMLTE